MANRRSFLAALWEGDLVGAAGALVAGILHMIVMLVFLLVLTAVSPILAVAMPFIAYQMSGDDVQLLALVYFILGAFPAGMFTGFVYCHVTRKERRAAGETFGEHCRKVLGWPTASLFCSWITSATYAVLFNALLFSDSNTAHAVFFALAPIAVFSPLWAFLIHRRRQKAAMERLSRSFDERRKKGDAEFLRNQGIVS